MLNGEPYDADDPELHTATHPLGAAERAEGREYGKPVSLGDRALIGDRAVLNPGVSVGDDAVIVSGAVVTDDVVVQGSPATVAKGLGTDDCPVL